MIYFHFYGESLDSLIYDVILIFFLNVCCLFADKRKNFQYRIEGLEDIDKEIQFK